MDNAEKILVGKVVVLGDQGVGKTSIALRYVEGAYNRFVSPTVGASYFSCNIKIDDILVKMQIWDTAGQERFRAMAPMFYRNASAALLVFDLTKPESFENLKQWVRELKGNVRDSIVLCIVGSKLDLTKDRKVSRDEALEYSHAIDGLYHECSSLTGEGINDIFQAVSKKLIQYNSYKARSFGRLSPDYDGTVVIERNDQSSARENSNCC